MVGAVIVQNGQPVATAYHQRFGGPHAEINALARCKKRGIDPAGCDLYVTLEPCAHHGKTDPCTDALIHARLKHVHAAMIDPNPAVQGQGIQRLQQAGIETHVGLLEQRAKLLNAPYIKRIATGLPWVIVKWAQTLDGRIATHTGDSKWISNPRSRLLVHRIRARVDAVIVGIGTVLADDPQLTARQVPLRRTARRVVIDPHLRIPHQARLLSPTQSDPASTHPPLTIAVRQDVFQTQPDRVQQLLDQGVELFPLVLTTNPSAPDLNLQPLLQHLATQHHATNILVEGGSKVVGSLLRQQLVDQVLVFIAPKILGDPMAIPAVQPVSDGSSQGDNSEGGNLEEGSGETSGGGALAQAHHLKLHTVRRLDDDVMLVYRVQQ